MSRRAERYRFDRRLPAVAAAIGLIAAPSIAAAAARLVCSSIDLQHAYCPFPTYGGVRVVQTLSRAPCIAGQSWGVQARGVWVTRGCSAVFSAGAPAAGPSSGDLAGALVVGGLVGALLGGAGDRDRFDDGGYDYRPPYPVRPRMAYDQAAALRDARQRQRDIDDRRQEAQQRSAYERNQQRQQEQAEAEERAQGEAEENRQALRAQAQAEEEAARQAQIRQGEELENRGAAEAAARASAEAQAPPNR